MVHYCNHNYPPLVPILNQLEPFHTLISHFLNIQLNIILPSTPGCPKWSLSPMSPHQNSVYASLLNHELYMPRPSQFDFITGTLLGETIKLLRF
jgi:hypothetical protein